MEEISLWAGFILTLMVFSYVLGDNFLYRLAAYVFVGLTAGYVTVITWNSVLMPWVRQTILSGGGPAVVILGAVPLVLGASLLFKGTNRFGRLGGVALALLIGVGTSVALVGSVSGTLIPLAAGAARPDLDLPSFLISIIGVVCALVYFQYSSRRAPSGEPRRALPISLMAAIGQIFIVVTLGALYAAAILTSLVVFTDRVAYLIARIGGS
jgi:ABC-type antimicrobial peptide transport system permease subunit